MKIIIVLMLFLIGIPHFSHAQIIKAEVGVNGLTCSQCSRSVAMALRALPFVKKVTMNLEQTSGEVLFKTGSKVAVKELAQAVTNAGFSTRFVHVTIDFKSLHPNEHCLKINQEVFYFLKPLSNKHPEIMTFQVIAKGLLPRKEWREYTLKPEGICHAKEQFYLKIMGT